MKDNDSHQYTPPNALTVPGFRMRPGDGSDFSGPLEGAQAVNRPPPHPFVYTICATVTNMGLQQPREVGIRELRQHASSYLAWVGKGHEIIVTNHGRPAARLVPISDPSEDRIETMIRSGELIGPEDAGDPLDVPIVMPSDPALSSQQILDELREDRL